MANTATYYVPNFQKGDHMYWAIASKAGSKAYIVLKDDNKIYLEVKKEESTLTFKNLALGTATYEGGKNLRIEIIVYDYEKLDIKSSINSFNITDTKSRIVGYGYNYCIEDWTDNDYNDYYINLVAWVK